LLLLKTSVALNGLLCADVPLRNYSVTHSCLRLFQLHVKLAQVEVCYTVELWLPARVNWS